MNIWNFLILRLWVPVAQYCFFLTLAVALLGLQEGNVAQCRIKTLWGYKHMHLEGFLVVS